MLLKGNWRIKKCCCFTVKVGTTIIGVLDIIGYACILLVVCVIPNEEYKANDSPTMALLRRSLSLPLNATTKAIFGMIAVISITVSGCLLHGNSNAKPKYMTPKVYWYLALLILNSIAQFMVVSSLLKAGESVQGLARLGQVFIGIFIGLLLIQVVRSRIADIEESDRPDIPFSRRFDTN